MKTRINIIDPVSTEFNRGSFCYVPYLLHNGLKESGAYEVNLIESFITEDLDKIPPADFNVICLWSYPQVDACILLAHLLPMNIGYDNLYFIGYTPLIKHHGLRVAEDFFGMDIISDPDFLRIAMKSYPKYYKDFTNLLLSDCDMHLKNLETGEKVYPLFTSYGCPNGCTFCPSTVNCLRKRTTLSEDETIDLLRTCKNQGYTSIHFTDEDFFFDIVRAFTILKAIGGLGLHLIALGSADAVLSFIDVYGVDVIAEAGLEVIEIGFESGSAAISKSMGNGKSFSSCERLAEMQDSLPFNIFWLVLTLYIGETITSLNLTGSFMRRFGFDAEDVVGRLRTNGTKGGLGQFFQPYHGTGILKVVKKVGEFLEVSGARLLPTYIPNSFLDSTITSINPMHMQEAEEWLYLYGVGYESPFFQKLEVGRTIRSYVEDLPTFQKQKKIIFFSILARMGVIC